MRSTSFYVSKNHSDFYQAKKESELAKTMRNGITAVARNYYFWKQQGQGADLSISQDFGIDVTAEQVDKNTGELLNIDAFNYSQNCFSSADVYGKVRTKNVPLLHSKISQKIARDTSGEWRSYWGLRSAYKNGKIAHKPRLPGYSRSRFGAVPYTSGMLDKRALKDGRLCFTTWSQGFELPDFVKRIQSAQLIPVSKDMFKLNVLFYGDALELKTGDKGIIAGIDLGKKNLLTVAFSDYRTGLIIDGSPVLNRVNHCNHVASKALGFYSRQENNRVKGGGEKRDRKDKESYAFLDNLREKTERQVKSYYTAVTNELVKQFCEAGVSKVVIGWSPEFKKSMNIGRNQNRQFMGIPHRLIVDDLKRKCISAGIEVSEVEESYTSKASFVDNDALPVFDKKNRGKHRFSGRRTKRGQYRTAYGACVNADLNGAYNIIRKELSDYGFDQKLCMMNSGSVVPRVNRVKISY